MERTGTIVSAGGGPQTLYALNIKFDDEPIDPINDPLNESMEDKVLRFVSASPGMNRERIALKIGRSVETVKRTVAALVQAGRIEHRGSKKTGGCFCVHGDV